MGIYTGILVRKIMKINVLTRCTYCISVFSSHFLKSKSWRCLRHWDNSSTCVIFNILVKKIVWSHTICITAMWLKQLEKYIQSTCIPLNILEYDKYVLCSNVCFVACLLYWSQSCCGFIISELIWFDLFNFIQYRHTPEKE